MSELPPALAKLNKQSTEAQIINEIRSILVNCDNIKDVIRFGIMDDGKSRNFLIETDNFSNAQNIIVLLGGSSCHCKTFSESAVLLSIAD